MDAGELEGRWVQFTDRLKPQYGEKKDEPMKETDQRLPPSGPQAWGSSPTEWMRFTSD